MIFLVVSLPDSRPIPNPFPFNSLLALLDLRFEVFGLDLITLLIYLLILEQQPLWDILGKKLNKYIPFNLNGCKPFMVSLVLNCKRKSLIGMIVIVGVLPVQIMCL